MAFFPLTMPYHHGTRNDRGRDHARRRAARDGVGLLAFFSGVSTAAVANAAIVWIAYRFADRVTAFMGAPRATGRGAADRVPPDVRRRADPGDRSW